MTVKFEGWNKDNTATIVEAYQNADEATRNEKANLLKIGALIGNDKPASIRSKLNTEGVYVKVESAKSNGGGATSKAEMTRAIETMLSLPKDSLDTLGKGNKAQLEALSKAIVAVSDQQDADAS